MVSDLSHFLIPSTKDQPSPGCLCSFRVTEIEPVSDQQIVQCPEQLHLLSTPTERDSEELNDIQYFRHIHLKVIVALPQPELTNQVLPPLHSILSLLSRPSEEEPDHGKSCRLRQ